MYESEFVSILGGIGSDASSLLKSLVLAAAAAAAALFIPTVAGFAGYISLYKLDKFM